jgi:hypothetical protein
VVRTGASCEKVLRCFHRQFVGTALRSDLRATPSNRSIYFFRRVCTRVRTLVRVQRWLRLPWLVRILMRTLPRYTSVCDIRLLRKIHRCRKSRNPSTSNIVTIGQTKKIRSTTGSPQHILAPIIATNSNQKYPTMTRKNRRLTVVEMGLAKTAWVATVSTV